MGIESPPERARTIARAAVDPRDARLPLYVGVTGHRHIAPEDVARLEKELALLFALLRADLPETPFVVASGLAEGADRIAARVALERGCRLVAVLPFARARYEEDFPAPESRREFAELLARAERVIELDGAASGYERAGVWIVRHSQLLVALWDGEGAQGKGGTADVVDWMLAESRGPSGAVRLPSGLAPADASPVVHLFARRAGSDATAPARPPRLLVPARPDERTPAEDAPPLGDELRRVAHLRHLAAYDREAARLAPDSPADAIAALASLGPEPEVALLARRYAAADALAQRMRKRRFVSLALLVAANLAALLLFLLGGPALAWYHAVLAANLAFFVWLRGTEILASVPGAKALLALLPAPLVRRLLGWEGRAYHRKHLDYRALAEGLRVAIAWRVAGIELDAADRFLLKQVSDVDWIRSALRVCHLESGAARAAAGFAADGAARIDWALASWVDDQRRYFARASERDRRWLRRVHLEIFVLFLAGWTGTALMPFLDGDWSQRTSALAATCFLVAGALGFFKERSLTSEQASQFAAGEALYREELRLLEELRARGDLDAVRTHLAELGTEALLENGLWLVLHRSRPMEGWKPG